jgi:hypothetical protein
VDDASDLRTRLIYASLQDDDLVRQLQEAQRTRRRRSAAPGGGSTNVPAPARGSRPWPVPAARDVIDLTDVPGTKEGTKEGTNERTTVPTGAGVHAPRPSEWSVDDPSYYLG